jgi:hypothetical protein
MKMNTILSISVLCLSANIYAQEYAPVISKTPIVEQLSNGGSRLIGYQVTYEYHGTKFNAQMPNDPGTQILIQNNNSNSNTSLPAVITSTTTINKPSTTIIERTPEVVYIERPQYIYSQRYYTQPPLRFEIIPGFGFTPRHHHHHY